VVVGAGSAGCVLANRLSEDPGATVLLLEAGGSDRHPNVRIPAAFSKQFKTRLDWDLETEPEPGCGQRRLYVPRGKALGGSSSMRAGDRATSCPTSSAPRRTREAPPRPTARTAR
jgi:choline dehydrogenase-like flavoprotein